MYQQPELVRGQNIIAAPTLIKLAPAPVRRLIGDLSDTAKVLMALDIYDIADIHSVEFIDEELP